MLDTYVHDKYGGSQMCVNLCSLSKTQKMSVTEEKGLNSEGQREQTNRWQRTRCLQM